MDAQLVQEVGKVLNVTSQGGGAVFMAASVLMGLGFVAFGLMSRGKPAAWRAVVIGVIIAGAGGWTFWQDAHETGNAAEEIVSAAARNELLLCPGYCRASGQRRVMCHTPAVWPTATTFVVSPRDLTQKQTVRLVADRDMAEAVVNLLAARGMKVERAKEVPEGSADAAQPGESDGGLFK